jgi:hypothetical protein
LVFNSPPPSHPSSGHLFSYPLLPPFSVSPLSLRSLSFEEHSLFSAQ